MIHEKKYIYIVKSRGFVWDAVLTCHDTRKGAMNTIKYFLKRESDSKKEDFKISKHVFYTNGD
jgi:hypothetical protein